MAREKKDMEKLYNDLWNGVYTLIDKPRFNTIDIVGNNLGENGGYFRKP